MNVQFLVYIFLIVGIMIVPSYSFGQNENPLNILFQDANKELRIGNFQEALSMYEDILKESPNNVSVLKMLGITYSNLEMHKKSLIQFYKVLEQDSSDVFALNGMGLGFGNLGEYQEAKKYFALSLTLEPKNTVTKNYFEYVNKIIAKFPYAPTEKPETANYGNLSIPDWIRNNARWWSEGQISDKEFISGIEFLVNNRIIQIGLVQNQNDTTLPIPDWIKDSAGWWSNGLIGDADFTSGIEYLIENSIIRLSTELTQHELEKKRQNDFALFNKYVTNIENIVLKEKRYIEFPNPSRDVNKKFLRDYIKWNFERQISLGNKNFPNPTFSIENDTEIIDYKIYVNEQPTGLPLDHVSTLNDSISFWENQIFTSGNDKFAVKFSYTNDKTDANIWVTWVIRELGAGVLGQAHVGKGVAEVSLGDYTCDGSFQLYDVDVVELIMRHELGHGIGLGHSDDPKNIMYPSLKQEYAYCILG